MTNKAIQRNMAGIYIGLGANLPSKYGAPAETLNAAKEALSKMGIVVAAVSETYCITRKNWRFFGKYCPRVTREGGHVSCARCCNSKTVYRCVYCNRFRVKNVLGYPRSSVTNVKSMSFSV